MARRDPPLEPAHTFLHGTVENDPVVRDACLEALLRDVNALRDESLNAEQEEAFLSGLVLRLMLLWGPAGTGKTTVLAGVVRAIVARALEQRRPVRIGIGAATYNAIDKLLGDAADALAAPARRGSLLASIPLYRLRSESALPTRDCRVGDVSRRDDTAARVAELLETPSAPILVAGTAQQLSRLAAQRHAERKPVGEWFDVLIIDEASQVPVADAATYFCLLAPGGRVILAGDDRQLGPVSKFEHPDTREGLFDSVFSYMRQARGVAPVRLTRNYRTNAEIATWPRLRFYDRQYFAHFPDRRLALESALPDAATPPPSWPASLPWTPHWATILDPNRPVVVLTYPARRHTLSNPFEAQAVASMATLLRRHLPGAGASDEEEAVRQLWARRLAVITPHRAQMSMIANRLVQSGVFPRRPEPQVNTVDRFQGQERDVILASYSVSDPDFIATEERFILDPRRFNVTLTRARAKFVLLVSESLVQYLPFEKDIAELAASFQLFVEEYCRPVGRFELPYLEGNRIRSMPVCMRCAAAMP